jgi:hypothetical protein
VEGLREEKVEQRNDERILGDGDFVMRVLASAEETMEKRYVLRSGDFDLGRFASGVSEVLGVMLDVVWTKGKYRRPLKTVRAQSGLFRSCAQSISIPLLNLP